MNHEFTKFIAVVEAGSISGAAKSLNISQPALSISLKNLEKQYGASLIDREGNNFKLTKAGAEVYETARRIQLEIKNLDDAIELIDSDYVSLLRVGMIDSIGSLLIPEMESLQSIVEISIDNSPRLIDMLKQNQIDVAFISKPPVTPKGNLTLSPIGNEPFVLVAHPDMFSELTHSIARLQTIPRFLSYNTKSTTHFLMMNYFEEIGLKVESRFSSTSPELLKLMAKNAKGAALLPLSMVADDISNGYLKSYEIFSFSRPIIVAHHSSRYIHESIDHLILRAKTLLALHGVSEDKDSV